MSVADLVLSEAERLGLTVGRRHASGIIAGRRVTVTIEFAARNSEAATVRAHLDPPFDLGLAMRRRIVASVIEPAQVTGNPDLDGEFVITADDLGRLRPLFSEHLTGALAALHKSSFELDVDDGGCAITLVVGFAVPEAGWLERALHGATQVVNLMDERRPDLSPAEVLQGHFAAARAIARTHGLTVTTSPLLISGPVDGRPFRLGAARTGHRKHHLFAQSLFETPLAVGLGLRRQTLFDGVRTFLGGQDILVGDEPFDKRFLIRAERPDRVPTLLDLRTRRLLLSLDEHYGAVSLDDNGLTVDPIDIHFQLDEMVILFEMVTEATARIAENLLHGGSSAGPYR